MIYTVTLNPALDYVLRLAGLDESKINRAKAELFCGGKGVNVSVMLKRLGVESTALGFTAGFTGKELERLLEAEGVSCAFAHTDCGMTRINVKIRTSAELDINADGPEITESALNEFKERLDALKGGDYLVLCGAVPESLPESIYEDIASRAENKGVKLVVDAEGKLLLSTLRYKPFLVKPNHIELGEMFGKELKGEEEIILYAKELQKLGAQNVLVSRGKDGALFIDKNGAILKAANVEGKPLNSVGCGDSMLAGFIAGYEKSKDFDEALKLGSACGNATAFTDGLATKEEIDNILKMM